jgi:hypothetical protein
MKMGFDRSCPELDEGFTPNGFLTRSESPVKDNIKQTTAILPRYAMDRLNNGLKR